MANIDELKSGALAAIESASSTSELETVRVKHLGRSAPLVLLLRGVSDLPAEERAAVGRLGNEVRKELESLVKSKMSVLEERELNERLLSERIDPTLPGVRFGGGTIHPLTATRRLIEDAFIGLGYRIIDGPEVEDEFHAFDALNTPPGHPARSEGDTFYVDGHPGFLLRTQTSTVQIRAMESQQPPLYVAIPGRVYRRDTIDATHSDTFAQMEALAVDEGLTLADLKGTLEAFTNAVFGAGRKVRMRPHFFPFTEPSVEVDVSCFNCGSDKPDSACRVCRGEGWIEIMGAGMVDPAVFSHIEGYDTEVVSGFAFGAGIERVAMLRHGIPDIRLFYENDLRFLRQFPQTV